MAVLTRNRFAVAVVVLTSLTSVAIGQGTSTPFSEIVKVARWLPRDTEALTVISTPWTIPAMKPQGRPNARSFREVVRDSRLQYVLDREGMWKRIGGETVRFWLDGSRRFRFPGISSVQPLICDSCQVFVFSKSVPQKLDSLLKAAKDARGGTRHVIRGYSVAEYLPESLRKSPQGFLVVLVRRRLPWIRRPLQGQQQCSDHIYCLANCRNASSTARPSA